MYEERVRRLAPDEDNAAPHLLKDALFKHPFGIFDDLLPNHSAIQPVPDTKARRLVSRLRGEQMNCGTGRFVLSFNRSPAHTVRHSDAIATAWEWRDRLQSTDGNGSGGRIHSGLRRRLQISGRIAALHAARQVGAYERSKRPQTCMVIESMGGPRNSIDIDSIQEQRPTTSTKSTSIRGRAFEVAFDLPALPRMITRTSLKTLPQWRRSFAQYPTWLMLYIHIYIYIYIYI